MATFRKRNGKWQVQVRRAGAHPVSNDLTSGASSSVLERPTSLTAIPEPTFSDPRAARSDTQALEALAGLAGEGTHFGESSRVSGLKPSTFKAARTRLKAAGKVRQDGDLYRVMQ